MKQMKPYRRLTALLVGGLIMLISLPSCKDKESYADLLRDETYAVNDYLANYPVINSIPADGEFETTVDIMESQGLSRDEAVKLTPFYRMDDEGYVYMQVVNPGTPDMKTETDQLVYFRFTRYNLTTVYKYDVWQGGGNAEDLGSSTTSFRYQNTTLSSTTQWGTGLQVPLDYLSTDCEVNLIVKSYVGLEEEVTAVYPYLYQIRYFPSKI